jgi:hypothetical protein
VDIQRGSGVEGESVGRKRACRVFLGREIWRGIWAVLTRGVRLVIGRGTYRVVSSPRCSQWVAEEPLRPGPSVGSEIERGEQRARGVGALVGRKGEDGKGVSVWRVTWSPVRRRWGASGGRERRVGNEGTRSAIRSRHPRGFRGIGRIAHLLARHHRPTSVRCGAVS